MAKRRSEPINAIPAQKLDQAGSSVNQNHLTLAIRSRQKKYSGSYTSNTSKHPRSSSATKANTTVCTRAQTRQLLQSQPFTQTAHRMAPSTLQLSAPLLRQEDHQQSYRQKIARRIPVSHPGVGAVRETRQKGYHLPSTSTPSTSTRAATVASHAKVLTWSGRGARRSRRDLKIQDRVGGETPDTSSCVEDVGHMEEEAAVQDRAKDEDVLNRNENCDQSINHEEVADEDIDNAENVVDNSRDEDQAADVNEVSDVSSSHEDEDSESSEEDNAAEDSLDSSSCRCTSTWSCGGHSCQRPGGACSSSTSKLQGKRNLSGEDETGVGDVSPCKKSCKPLGKTKCDSCGQRLPAAAGLKLGAAPKPPRQRIPSREHPPPRLQQWLDMFKSWSNAERMMALDDLISLCEASQVRHMMHIIEPQFQRDFISLLPKELALYVLSFLDARDLLRAAQTCQYWHVLCEDNLLWREKCREEGISESLVYGSRLRRRPGNPSPCKALYMRQSQIEQNWRTGTSKPTKILKGHDDHVITCLEFCGHRIVSGSDDNTLKVWSVLTGKCLRTLVGHTGGVWSSQMSGSIIISGSTDRTLKVWNAETGACRHTLYGHTSTVRCMALCGIVVVSGSRDATLRVWDVETGQCLHVLMGHVAAVRCVQFDGRRVVSGAYDYTVRVWDPETETCLHALQGHSNRVYSLQFDGIHVVSGSLDTSIRVWDVETGACLHTLIGHQSLTSGLELKDNILVSGNADSTVKVWDITTGQCLQTLQGPHKHQSAVTCLQFSKKFVITSSDDGTVKIWDLRSGEFLRNLVSLDSGGSGGVVWRLRCSNTKLVCAVGSRNGTEETKLMVLDFDVDDKRQV